MKKILFILTTILTLAAGCNSKQPQRPPGNIQPAAQTATPTTTTNLRNLPQDECPCWDGKNNVCLPQSDCE